MSHVALRRVMVRLLHDPSFVEAVYADPSRALAGIDVDAAERAELLHTPRAAWGVDPERPARVLFGLREEFAVALRAAAVDPTAFLRSPQFHAAVQDRGSLAAAFGAWLDATATPLGRAFARIDGAIAAVRRAPRRLVPSPAGRLALSPQAARVDVPSGTLDGYRRLRDGGTPLVHDEGGAPEHLLVVRMPGSNEVTIEALPEALAALLDAARTAVARDALHAVARDLGADPGEDAAIVAQLVADGVLV